VRGVFVSACAHPRVRDTEPGLGNTHGAERLRWADRRLIVSPFSALSSRSLGVNSRDQTLGTTAGRRWTRRCLMAAHRNTPPIRRRKTRPTMAVSMLLAGWPGSSA
jgi:hypothetical protein